MSFLTWLSMPAGAALRLAGRYVAWRTWQALIWPADAFRAAFWRQVSVGFAEHELRREDRERAKAVRMAQAIYARRRTN